MDIQFQEYYFFILVINVQPVLALLHGGGGRDPLHIFILDGMSIFLALLHDEVGSSQSKEGRVCLINKLHCLPSS